MTYLDYDVWLTRPTRRKTPSITITSDNEMLGKLYSQQRRVFLYNLPISEYVFEFFQYDQSERQTLLAFFDSMKGRYGKFWLPSFKQDVSLTQASGGGEEILYIQNINFTYIYYGDGYPKHLLIRLPSSDFGCVVYGSDIVDADTEELYISPVLPEALATTKEINFLSLVRFNQDELLFTQLEGNSSTCNIKFLEVINEYPEEWIPI